MFCVECGKECLIFRDGVCKECYLKTHSFTSGPSIMDLPVCVHCNSYKFKNTWTNELLADVLKRIIKNNFQISKELEKVDINIDCKEEKDGLSCKLYISGFIEDQEINEEHIIHIRLKRSVCDVCSKQSGGYYESIVQIRQEKTKLTRDELDDIISIVSGIVEDLRAKGNRALFITDMGEEHGGLDFYLSERNAGLIIAKKLQNQYGGEIKQSSKSAGTKDSRELYRVTYLIRLPSYKKGDFLKIGNCYFYIVSIHGDKLKTINLTDWEETAFDAKTMQKADIVGGKELIKEMILISQTKDEIQFMDSKNYKTIELKKPRNIHFEDKTVKIVEIYDDLYLLPITSYNK